MNLLVVVVDRGRFDRWIDDQARPAIAAGDAIASAGEQVFFSRGCAACHTVRGTAAQGRVGPDLTHVGSRQSIAAGTMPMTSQDLRRWISGSDVIKPEAHMPAFSGLVEQELTGLAAYLLALK
jgi:cytochrome c oxidase subunit 2